MTKTVSFSYDDLARRRTQLFSVNLSLDIYDWYQEMQQSHAVFFDASRAAWLVFRYAEVQQVMRDPQTFSSQLWRTNSDGKDDPTSPGMLGMDPPRHSQLRALVSQAFTPRTVAGMESYIISIVEGLLDRIAHKREADLIAELAFPLPALVIAQMLGVPQSDHEHFRRWASEFVADGPRRNKAVQTMEQYFREMIAQRRREPQEDLISRLLHAEIDGERLPEDELIETCYLLLVAGHETTVGLISNALICFDEHPENMQELIARPELLPTAIEEVLRYRGVVHTSTRMATVDSVLGGQKIPAGDLVLPIFASANLDERQFPDASTFLLRRTPNRHLGFGYGSHFCLGAPLARLESRIALQQLLARFPTIRRRRNIPLVLKPSHFIYGLEQVPVEW
jgi:cytochrome P450